MLFLLNHSVEYYNQIRPLISKAKNPKVIFESPYGKKILLKLFPGDHWLRSGVSWDPDLNYNQVVPKYNYKTSEYWPDIDRHMYWGSPVPSIADVHNSILRYESVFLNNIQKGDVVVYERLTCLMAWVAYKVCHDLGAIYVGIESSRLSDGTVFFDGVNEITLPVNSQISSEVGVIPSYMNSKNRSFIFSLKKHLFLLIYWRNKFKTIQLNKAPLTLISWRLFGLKKFLRSIIGNELLKLNLSGGKSGKKIIFPLHYHPEASTSTDAFFLPSDVDIALIVANSLNSEDVLYVKEHPHFVGGISFDQKGRLNKHPNIKLVSSKVDTGKLLDEMDALITINSTMLFEALDRGLPTGTFGRIPLSKGLCNQVPKILTIGPGLFDEIQLLVSQGRIKPNNYSRVKYREMVHKHGPFDLTEDDIIDVSSLISASKDVEDSLEMQPLLRPDL